MALEQPLRQQRMAERAAGAHRGCDQHDEGRDRFEIVGG
jgi:hypothetical protein